MIPLSRKPQAVVLIKLDMEHCVVVTYDRRGNLRLIRRAGNGQLPEGKPASDETVFRVKDLIAGEASFKSGRSNCGYFSINGYIYWSTIWDDDDSGPVKKSGFQEWVDECAQVLSGTKSKIATG
jgi:hypothetical protein